MIVTVVPLFDLYGVKPVMVGAGTNVKDDEIIREIEFKAAIIKYKSDETENLWLLGADNCD